MISKSLYKASVLKVIAYVTRGVYERVYMDKAPDSPYEYLGLALKVRDTYLRYKAPVRGIQANSSKHMILSYLSKFDQNSISSAASPSRGM
jgi:hypothetical protein